MAPKTLVAKTCCMSASSSSSSGANEPKPALLTRTLKSANSRRTCATRRTQSLSTPTSAWIATAPIFFAAFSSFALSRPRMATRAPRAASSFAVSNPIPEEPPVTSALALSIFMPAFYVRMRVCPSCGREPQDLLVSADAIAEEMALRRKFFASRIDGWVEPAQQKDRVDVAQHEPAEVRVCRGCGILVRQRGDSERFESDPYAPHVMEQMLRTYIDEFRAREARIRPLLPGTPAVLEIGSYVGGFLHVAREWGWDAQGLDVGEDTSHFTRSKGYPTRTAPLEECRFDDASFDGVFIWNT